MSGRINAPCQCHPAVPFLMDTGKQLEYEGEYSFGGSTDCPEILDLVAKLAQQLMREELLKKE